MHIRRVLKLPAGDIHVCLHAPIEIPPCALALVRASVSQKRIICLVCHRSPQERFDALAMHGQLHLAWWGRSTTLLGKGQCRCLTSRVVDAFDVIMARDEAAIIGEERPAPPTHGRLGAIGQGVGK